MKKILSLAIALVALAACKKESNDNGNEQPYVSAKVDGVQKTFDFDVKVIRLVASGITSLNIQAAQGPGNAEGIWLQVNAEGNVAQTTYLGNGPATAHANGFFIPDNSGLFYGAGQEYLQTDPINVTISRLDSAIVEGTFSGTFYYTDTAANVIDSSKTRVITNGKFLAKMPM